MLVFDGGACKLLNPGDYVRTARLCSKTLNFSLNIMCLCVSYNSRHKPRFLSLK